MRQFLTLLNRVSMVLVCCVFASSAYVMAQPRWQWIVPATGPNFDEGADLALFPDGSLMMVGVFSDSLHVDSNRINGFNGYDGFSVRVSNTGKLQDYDAYGGLIEDEVRSVAVDNKGNYYVCGTFEDQAMIGGTLIESIEPFTIDMFVAKFDKTGILQWTNVFGAPDYDEPPPFVAVDSVGNVYLAGGFGKTATFGTKSVTSTGGNDIFVAKITSLGDVTWVKRAGSLMPDAATDVAVSPNGDRVFVVGNFSGTVDFGGTAPIGSYAGEQDIVVWTLSADGAYQWAKRIGYQGKDGGIRCFADASGNLLTTGGMMQTTTFDDKTLKANGEFEPDVFVCRFTKTGAIDLLTRYGGTFKDVGYGITSDSRGAIYIAGQFDSTSTLGSTVLISNGGLDAFLMRLWPNGSVEWARSAGGSFDDVASAVAVSAEGVPYICGTFDTQASFDGEIVQGERFTDAFVAALECGPNTALTPSVHEMTICAGADSSIYAPSGYDTYTWYSGSEHLPNPTKSRLGLSTLTEGLHLIHVEILDLYGCTGTSDTITVTVTPGLPEPVITRDGNVLNCSVAGVTYQWYREGQTIPGATGQTADIDGDGLYKVLISDDKGCNRMSANFLVGTTNVDEQSDHALLVWPNPFNEALEVQATPGSRITVSDVLGNVVYTTLLPSERTSHVVHAVPGTYVVTVMKNGQSTSQLIIKQ